LQKKASGGSNTAIMSSAIKGDDGIAFSSKLFRRLAETYCVRFGEQIITTHKSRIKIKQYEKQ
jgi:hypothetical protein